MTFEAGVIVLIGAIVAMLVLVLATGRRRSVGRSTAEAPRSGWLGTAAWLGIFGASAGTSHTDDDSRGGDGHGPGGDGSGGQGGGGDYGGGDYGGGGGWGGGDFGGGGGDGGGGGGGGN